MKNYGDILSADDVILAPEFATIGLPDSEVEKENKKARTNGKVITEDRFLNSERNKCSVTISTGLSWLRLGHISC